MDKVTRMRVEYLFAGLLLLVAAIYLMVAIVGNLMNPSNIPPDSLSSEAPELALFAGILCLGTYYVIKCWWLGSRARAPQAPTLAR
jgi:hypothetical protein